MAVPYSDSIAQALDGHLRVRQGNSWRYVEDVNVRHSGSWRDVKEVWIRHSGSWRLVHEGEHFLFNVSITSNSNTQWSLSSYISGLGYSGNKIKGAVTVANVQQRMNLNNFSSDSKVYLRINSNRRIVGAGGNGGNRGGNNGGNGQRALRSEGTPFIIDNGGIIAGGGGGGGGGNNSNCVYQNTNYFSCQKGEQCSEIVQNQSPAYGGGGGGGAGYPGGQGKNGGNNGQNFSGGGGGSSGGCGSNSGGGGGDLGQNGQNATGGNGGTKGTGVEGWNHKYATNGSGNGDIRGGTSNT